MTNHSRDSFLQGNNASYLSALYSQYCEDPFSVAEDWREYFQSFSHDVDLFKQEAEVPQQSHHHQRYSQPAFASVSDDRRLSEKDLNQARQDSTRVLMLIRAYKVRGHLHAHLDPLKLEKRPYHSELLPETYGFKESDWDRPIFIDKAFSQFEFMTLRNLMTLLTQTYCQSVGVEFMHIQMPEKRQWISDQLEKQPLTENLTSQNRHEILTALTHADSFERFLHVKYPGVKRFGLEGGESLIPGLEALVHRATHHGIEDIVFGMAHRGRLGVLAHIIHKPLGQILSHFQAGKTNPESVCGSGDVKYHVGYEGRRTVGGKVVRLGLEPNPSHLEAVNPVVLGDVRAKQALMNDTNGDHVMGVLLHGDAAFAGQGLVAETLELCDLKGYRTGGTVHIIINNQIGFTTSPPHSRSSPYSSDSAKCIQAPIFHVNGDDPEAVFWVMKIAMDYRQLFKHDVVVDMVCYRRHGHNEIDEPSFTQPLMYKAIASHPSPYALYKKNLLEKGVVTESQIQTIFENYNHKLQEAFQEAEQTEASTTTWTQWLDTLWGSFKQPEKETAYDSTSATGLRADVLKRVGLASLSIPSGFKLHPRLERQFKNKRDMVETGELIDWAMGESLAFGSLVGEKISVRLSGQDCGRGTFSHRHMVWVDQETEEKYIALNHQNSHQALIEVVDSPLAEASVLGFEYGYSLTNPNALVMWEAQFGDFSNGAQVIIDQFISSGELKWGRKSGVVLLLPHGYEGQGPEHSSARLERYLQLCAEQNMRVVNCTTPANYFHVLRRQLYSPHRKPLVVMTPKSLLRHKMAVSSFADMTEGTSFMSVIEDGEVNTSHVNRVLLCSGKIYYDLLQRRTELGLTSVALIRIEQYYPFPHHRLVDVLAPYHKAEIFWCQEEPMNMGAWSFLNHRLQAVLQDCDIFAKTLRYIGRPEAAAPATGLAERHNAEQDYILNHALKGMDHTLKAHQDSII